MASVRELTLWRFPSHTAARESDEQLASSLYSMLWSIDGLEVSVDGWNLFRVIRESGDTLDAVGLMTLLPTGSIPIAINVRIDAEGLAWSVRVARQDQGWLALSDSKRWNSVYLYATRETEEPDWTWGTSYEGVARIERA